MPAKLISGDIREHDPSELKLALQQAGINRIDTAARYGNGGSEKKIGNAGLPESFTVDTKIIMPGDAAGSLTAANIEKSLSNSLQALGVEKVHVLYCHAPDHQTPIEEQAKAFDEQYKKGRFDYLGVSNFSTKMVEEWLEVAASNGYVKPSVFQGQYNLVCRTYEETLFPTLRKNKIHFNAFSPLAGGFLLGNFTADGVQGGSRFALNTPFTTWYNKPSMHEAIKKLRDISEKTGIGMDELSLRWVVYHSALNDEDGVLLGSSKVSQITKNVSQVKKGPLDKSVVQQLNGIWEGVKEDAKVIIEY